MSNRIYFPIAGCIASILEWIRSSVEEALRSPWLSHGVSDPPVPDASEVVDRPSSPTMPPSPPPNDQRTCPPTLPPSPHPNDQRTCSPPSPTPKDRAHDFLIFLSFRGEDTRNGFTGHLYYALSGRSLKTFIDSKDLHKGEKIDQLFRYIERSKVFVPIISERYAESKWCLKEITKIVDCAGDRRLILPIFFGVEPSHIRHQTGPFDKYFKAYENDKNMDKEEVKKWRDALRAVSNLSGYNHNIVNGNEAKLVEKVVSDLLRHLDSGRMTVADHPVGIESRVEDMMKLLQIERDDVNKMVGIVGTGGIGKTTIAKAVFNRLGSEFALATFLPHVRETWKTTTSQGALMTQMVKDLLKDEISPVHDIATGKASLERRVPFKKVLIVLDDVDRIEQFQELIGGALYGRFTAGSRIIITSRDENVLTRCGVEKGDFYKPVLLDAEQSLLLFRSYAFPKCDRPDDKYLDMSKKIVAIAGGLPLALRVFGSYLTNRTDLDKWNGYLGELQQNRRKNEIEEKLRISYEALSEFEKYIFLDISCFFHTNCHREANFLWKSLDWHPKSAIDELCSKSLISIRDDGGYEMHDLIRDMGRSIVQEGGRHPWMWSRLWTAYDTRKTIDKSPRNEAIEGIDVHGTGKEIFRTEAFGEMTNLRILILDGIGKLEGENFMLPEDLKFLYLRRVEIQSLSSCNFENVIALELDVADEVTKLFVKKSFQTQAFEALKYLNIFCHEITVTPDFSNMPNLEHVEFSYCASLVEVHESIGKLRKVKYLKFLQFLNAEKLTDAICELSSLETLIIRQFPRLESLPERLGNLERLNLLHLEDLAITSIPSSIGQLTRLREMYLRKLDRLHDLPDSISSLNDLQVFDMEGTDLKGMKIDGQDLMHINQLEISSCNCISFLPISSLKRTRALRITDGTIEEVPKSIEAIENIEQLSLRCKNLMALPEWLPNLKKLKTFEVDCESLASIISKVFSLRSVESLSLHCAKLEELPAAITETLVENIKSFTLRCKNLKALPEWIGSLESLESLKLEACDKITELPSCIDKLSRLQELALNGCKRIRSVPRLPSSLLVLDASECSDLGKTLDVSNLESLQKLRLGGCTLLEDVQGIENAARNMEELVLPGPHNSIDCSRLNDDFKRKVFKELAFERLRRYEIWGSLALGSATDHQQLAFMLPNVGANSIRLVPRIERLVLNNVSSVVDMKLVEDDHRVIFQSTHDIQRPIVKNLFRPIWIPLPRSPSNNLMPLYIEKKLRYPGPLIGEAIPQPQSWPWGTLRRWISIPCHERCALSSISALHGSEAVEVEEEVVVEGQIKEAEEEVERTEIPVQVVEVAEDDGMDESEWIRWISTPCHVRRALSSSSALHGSEAVEVEEEVVADGQIKEAEEEVERTEVPVQVEVVAEDDGMNEVVHTREAEDEQHGDGNTGVGAFPPKIIQVFQPNRVHFFVASYPAFIHWKHEFSEESCDYKVDFKKEDLIQERLRVAEHPTVLVSADTSNLTTIRMTFSFVGENCV